MSIISTIGRKSLKVRCLIWSIYLVLTLGALTMIYPFWLMISGTGKSSTDVAELKIIPSYLVNDDAYYRKTVASLFNEYVVSAQMLYNMPIHDFRQLEIPVDKKEKFCKEWEEFLALKNFPFYYYMLGHSHAGVSNNTRPENFRIYKDKLFDEFNGDLSAMNDAKGTEFATWNSLMVKEQPCVPRRNMPNPTVKYNEEWYMFKSTVPKHHRIYVNASGFFKGSFLYPQYSKEVENYNKSHKTSYKDYADVRLTQRYPANGTAKEREDW